MVKAKKDNKLILIGLVLLVMSPVLFLLLPQLPFFFDFFCSPDMSDNGCGYANLGIVGYALYISLIPFILGLFLLILGVYVAIRRRGTQVN